MLVSQGKEGEGVGVSCGWRNPTWCNIIPAKPCISERRHVHDDDVLIDTGVTSYLSRWRLKEAGVESTGLTE